MSPFSACHPVPRWVSESKKLPMHLILKEGEKARLLWERASYLAMQSRGQDLGKEQLLIHTANQPAYLWHHPNLCSKVPGIPTFFVYFRFWGINCLLLPFAVIKLPQAAQSVTIWILLTTLCCHFCPSLFVPTGWFLLYPLSSLGKSLGKVQIYIYILSIIFYWKLWPQFFKWLRLVRNSRA